MLSSDVRIRAALRERMCRNSCGPPYNIARSTITLAVALSKRNIILIGHREAGYILHHVTLGDWREHDYIHAKPTSRLTYRPSFPGSYSIVVL